MAREEFVEEFDWIIFGEGERIRRLMLKADGDFKSEKLEGMLEELSHNGLLEETKEADEGVPWSCSLDQGCICESLK